MATTLAWIEKNAAETRLKDPDTGRMVRAGNQKIVAATFRLDASRNLRQWLHTHAWPTRAGMSRQKLIGMLYDELSASLSRLGYSIEKIHANGRFEIAGIPRETVGVLEG